MKPLTLLLFISIITFPMLYIGGCAPYSATYGVSVHGEPYWGHNHHRRHYHHRPAYRNHYRHHRRR